MLALSIVAVVLDYTQCEKPVHRLTSIATVTSTPPVTDKKWCSKEGAKKEAVGRQTR